MRRAKKARRTSACTSASRRRSSAAPATAWTGIHDCFGAQIDMRQVYLTVGGSWGQILAGRELGLFGRQNILTDQTLFGVGATGGQLGRRDHPRPHRLRLHLSAVQGADDLLHRRGPALPALRRSLRSGAATSPTPRSRSRGSRPRPSGPEDQTKIWVGGSAPDQRAPVSCGRDGHRVGCQRRRAASASSATFSLTACGYYGKGIGTTLLFLGNAHRRPPAAPVATTSATRTAASASSPLRRPTAR